MNEPQNIKSFHPVHSSTECQMAPDFTLQWAHKWSLTTAGTEASEQSTFHKESQDCFVAISHLHAEATHVASNSYSIMVSSFMDVFLGSQLYPALFPTSALALKGLTYKPASVWPFHPTLISLLHPGPHYLKSKCWAAALYDSSCHLGAKHRGEVGPGRNFSVFPFITIKGLSQILSDRPDSKIENSASCLFFPEMIPFSRVNRSGAFNLAIKWHILPEAWCLPVAEQREAETQHHYHKER